MTRHQIPELAIPQEVPLVARDSTGKRVLIGRAVVLVGGGIAAYFDGDVSDSSVKSIVSAITRGAVNALSIAPSASDIVPKPREREQ